MPLYIHPSIPSPLPPLRQAGTGIAELLATAIRREVRQHARLFLCPLQQLPLFALSRCSCTREGLALARLLWALLSGRVHSSPLLELPLAPVPGACSVPRFSPSSSALRSSPLFLPSLSVFSTHSTSLQLSPPSVPIHPFIPSSSPLLRPSRRLTTLARAFGWWTPR